MTLTYFVTGTDTGVGKTYCTVVLLEAFRVAGHAAMAMKPVASGCTERGSGWVSDDALRLIEAAAVRAPYQQVNPYAFAGAVSPHIAAAGAGVRIELDAIVDHAEALRRLGTPLLVEGAGGWMSPLDHDLWQADVAKALDAAVLLVVGLKLGCINHALLSARAIHADGCRLLGWVGNHIDASVAQVDAVVETLRQELPAPCLGIMPWGEVGVIDPVAFTR